MQWVFGAPRDGLEAQGRAVRSSLRTHRGTRVFSCQVQDESSFHFACAANTPHAHLCESGKHVHLLTNSRNLSASQLTTASGRPAGSMTVTVAFLGPVSSITRAPRSQQASPRSGSSTAISTDAQRTNREGYGGHGRKKIKIGVV